MEDEDTDEKRRQRSDEARRAAMRQKIQQQKDRDRQIAIDIANVDKKATKRIVFNDSDDDDDEVEEVTENGEKKSSSNNSKRPKLFDSEEEEDDDEDGNEIEIKNRHSGPKGEQLMKLESRFNSDPRFKLDDKFAESESDDDVGNETQTADKQEMKMEKDKNRELLSKILGKSVEEKKPKTTETSTLKARPFTRFDPENPEHLAWMKEFEASKNPQKSKKEEKTQESDEEEDEGKEDKTAENGKEKTDENEEDSDNDNYEKAEIFFKMDEKFSAEMKERNGSGETSNAGFSFLSMMGRKYEDSKEEEDDDDIDDEVIEEKHSKKEKNGEKTSEKVEKVGKALLKVKVSTKFFVDPLSDEKIRSMAANFRRTQTVEKVIDKWAPHRDAIFKLWKKQRRDAVKKQRESFFTNGKRKRKAENESEEKTETV